MNKIYQEEQNKALEYLIKQGCKECGVEFIFSKNCNLKCSYCYLMKHGKELMPEELENEELILNNLKKSLNYMKQNNLYCSTIDFFSGEFFNLPYWEKAFDIFYDVIKERKITEALLIPSNFSFLNDDNKTKKIEEYIKKFKEQNVHLSLSASVDGKFLDNKQRKTKKENYYSDDFYDKVFSFCKKYGYGFHPMVSALNIEDWKENYLWYYDNIVNKYCIKQKTGIYRLPMMLEVRDDNWTDDKIEKYSEWQTFVLEYELKNLHNNNVEEMANRLLNCENEKNRYVYKLEIDGKEIYNNLLSDILYLPRISTKVSCSIQNTVTIRLADMALVPCHRTMYPSFIYGKIKEDGTFEENNLSLAAYITTFNPVQGSIRCSGCPLKTFCTKGCFGAQYEYTGDILKPCDTVCNFYFSKYKTLHNFLKKQNMWEIFLRTNVEDKDKPYYANALYIKKILDKTFGEYYNE